MVLGFGLMIGFGFGFGVRVGLRFEFGIVVVLVGMEYMDHLFGIGVVIGLGVRLVV